MPKLVIKARPVEPGTFIYFSLDCLTRPARKERINFADCGVCGYQDHYWLGERAQAGGKDVLLVSALDALDKRDEEYPGWGEEELYVLVGRNGPACEPRWFLRNAEERKRMSDANPWIDS